MAKAKAKANEAKAANEAKGPNEANAAKASVRISESVTRQCRIRGG